LCSGNQTIETNTIPLATVFKQYNNQKETMAPVVVQGTAVSPPQAVGVSYGDGQATATAATENEPSKTGCKDPIFAVLFYVNIIAIVVVVITYGKEALNSSSSVVNYSQ
jgi:hypothetical protein